VDPTGAGDSFAGGLISYLASRSKGAGIEPETLKQALAYATIIASFNVEGFGIEGLDEKDSKTIRSRFQKFREFSSIPNLLEGEV
jgi:fructose-1-phosphate kinase PfkB-like protein